MNINKNIFKFVGKILLLTEHIEEKHELLKDVLKKAVIDMALNVAEGYGAYDTMERQKYLLSAQTACFYCLSGLFLLRTNRSLGNLSYAALKTELEDILNLLTQKIIEG